jgi:NADH dehydrogenase
LVGVFDGMNVVVHTAGIAREQLPDMTFERINVDGTAHVVAECRRAKRAHLIFISSLGADRGSSRYHASKRRAELLVREYRAPWTILRPGNVYGASGGEISLFLEFIRLLPVVPVVGNPDKQFQPVAAEDLAAVVLACLSRGDVVGRTLEIAGAEITSQRDLYERIARLVRRRPPLFRVPKSIALAGAQCMRMLQLEPPVWRDQLEMIEDGNVLLNRAQNTMRDMLGIEPTTLDDGLRRMAHDTPEQFPHEGAGRLVRRRFWVDIDGSRLDCASLMALVRRDFARLMPESMIEVGTEEVSEDRLIRGATISIALPARGHVQVRVEEVTKYSVTCVTLGGHPLSGVVRFLSEQRGECIRFEVQTIDKPRNSFDRIVMAALGTHLKRITWVSLLRNVSVSACGSAQNAFGTDQEPLDELKAARVQRWMHELVARRMQSENNV